jgi:methionine-rich copper-binding protein CopC
MVISGLSGRAAVRWRAVLASVAAIALVLLVAPTASAHDSLVSSSPADGQTVATMPDSIVLTMNEAAVAVGTRVVVSGPHGEVQQGRPRLSKNLVEQALEPSAPAGRYTVTWRVTSADGHPVSGTFSFTASAAGESTSSGPAISAPSTTAASAPTTVSGQADAPTPGSTSGSSTGESGQSGTSWAVWLVLALLVLAGAGATPVRRGRGRVHRGRKYGPATSTPRDGVRR